MGKYFGTDGFRGEAGITLTADHAYKVGRFLGWYYNALRERNGDTNPARIVIGKDTRRSSYMFEYSLVAGLTASGADAYLLHVTTTPSVAYIARVDDFDCGIMISASHNPYYDNGIKLIDCYGEKMPEETLLLVEDYIDGKLHVFDKDWPELPFAHREHIGCTVDYVAGRNRYMGYLISLGIYSFKGVKVGLDCANGSSWNIAKSVFDALGADTYVINNKPNGTNINNNAGSTHIEGLQKFVVEKGLDVGFAYDGDADRCLCVDEKGNVITGDHILYIYGCYMKERGKLLNNTVVTTVMSNFGLYKAFDEQGIGYAKTVVGDKYVYEYMAKNGYRFWVHRIGYSSKLFDIIRIDHFRAFDTYWKIPASCPTAVEGQWIEAPGYQVIDTLKEKIPDVNLVAEDLGDLRPEVLALRDHYHLKGMKILVFILIQRENMHTTVPMM